MRRYIRCHDTIGRNNRALAYGHTLGNAHIRANPDIVTYDYRCLILIALDNDIMSAIIISNPDIPTDMDIFSDDNLLRTYYFQTDICRAASNQQLRPP